ncbi:hypothetical protein [Allorhizocola rhizosphaerae]|uniref:hypothetical protein n=1 Tax=Allorhizocola rhizosphaerae TaxID=1872709 RepID=UPI0013C3324B|nr:hypothetical protein [Allorhizocola rhizosphaerae]
MALSFALLMPAAQQDLLAVLAQQLQKDVAKVWTRTGEIWPGVDFANHAIVLTDGSRALAIDREGATETPMQDITAPQPGGFAFTTWQGRDAVVLTPYPGQTARELFETASHEAFHQYVQDDWASLRQLQGAGSRAERYPLRAEPRVLRMQLANELIAGHLPAAAHWHTQWAQRYPEEEQELRATDIAEGSAEYFGRRAAALAADTTPALKPMQDKNKQYESYAIGAAALLLADQTGRPAKQDLSREVRTPAAVVLDGVTPAAQPVPAGLAQRIQAQTDAENAALAGILDPYLKAYQEKRPLLVVPGASLAGSFQPTGFFQVEGVPDEILTETSAAFDLSTGGFEIRGVTVGMDGGDFLVPIEPGQPGVELTDGKLIVDTPDMRGSFQVKEELTDGRRLLRAQ